MFLTYENRCHNFVVPFIGTNGTLKTIWYCSVKVYCNVRLVRSAAVDYLFKRVRRRCEVTTRKKNEYIQTRTSTEYKLVNHYKSLYNKKYKIKFRMPIALTCEIVIKILIGRGSGEKGFQCVTEPSMATITKVPNLFGFKRRAVVFGLLIKYIYIYKQL